ncbi:MAG: sigma-70 family RNA polymerase sigma factor [Planctomycetota bacterium]|nr:MAG: sigma-70 family RNA polymerase sigma factor [Planctomycetota bacterium]
MSVEHNTCLLERAVRGARADIDRLMRLVYEELRALASHYLRAERPDHTLQPTALVHEAYLRMIQQRNVDWRGRTHFFAIAAECVRRVLVDHARRQKAQQRGGAHRRVSLSGQTLTETPRDIDVQALDEALNRLRNLNARHARVVELRFFGGLTGDEIAEVLGVSRSTVFDDWAVARAWLSAELGKEYVA